MFSSFEKLKAMGLKLLFCNAVFLVLLLSSITNGFAQDLVGGIRGRIFDADFGGALAGVTVLAEGSNVSVSTDENGAFTLTALPPGKYDLSIFRDGYTRKRVAEVVVNAGAFTSIEEEITSDVTELEDFVVSTEDLLSGDSASLLAIQQSTTSISNVMGADFISRIGASDVGKALQKVAGVSVVGDRYVVVRGLSDRYNVVLLNSAGVPSSDPDRRAVNIDLFPGSIVRNLITSKTFSPDLPGEATGGSIDIITKSVPDKDFTKFKLGLAYDTSATGNSKFLTYQGGGTSMLGTLNERRLPDFVKNASLPQNIANGDSTDQEFRDKVNEAIPRTFGASRVAPGPDFGMEFSFGRRGEFFGMPAGVIVGLDYGKRYRYEGDSVQGRYDFGPNGESLLTRRLLNVERGTETLRSSLIAVAGVQPQPGDEVKLTYFSNLSAQDRASLRFGRKDFFPGQETVEGEQLGVQDFAYRESLTYTERRLNVLQISGRHHWADADIDERTILNWTASYNMSSQDEPDQRFIETDTFNLERFAFPSVLNIPPVRRYWRELDDTKWNIDLDLEHYFWKTDEVAAKFKTGATFDISTREYRADNFAYNPTGRNNDQGFPSITKPSPYEGSTWGNSWNYGNPLNVDIDPNTPNNGHFIFRTTPPETYTASQIILAGYLMLDWDLSPSVNVSTGFRAEQTDLKLEGSDISGLAREDLNLAVQLLPPEDRTPENIQDLAAGGERAANNVAIQSARFVRLSQTDVLPAFNVKWKVTDEMNLRGVFSQTIARPSFKELAPVAFRDAETGDDFVGNSQLKISHISNYDVRWEWYRKVGGSLAVTGFSKFIKDPIEKAGSTGLQQFINTEDAVIYGFEVEGEQNLGFLSSELKAFTISANYTYMRSVAQRDSFSIFGSNRRLQGQPDYILNFNLTYEEPAIGLTAGIFLNVTGAYLDIVGIANNPDIFVEPLTTLNAFIALKIGKSGKLTLRGSNLTSPTTRKVYNNGRRDIYELVNTSTTYSLSYEMEF